MRHCGAGLSDKTNPDENTGKDPNGSSGNSNGSNDKGKTGKGAVKTGDTANVAGYLSILVLAAGVVVLAISRKRRTK